MKTTTLNMILAALAALALALVAIAFTTGCSSGDDDSNCMATENCPDIDAGQMTADADPAAPDANLTPDANSDPCVAYANVPSDGWQCTSGGPAFDVNGLTFVTDQGVCHLRSDSIWCQDIPPAADVQAGQFNCTDIGTQAAVTCWHNNL